MNELQILEMIHNSPDGHIGYTELTNKILSSGYKEIAAAQKRIAELASDGLIRGTLSGDCALSLTPLGVIRLERLQQAAKDKAKTERQQRFDNKIAVANVLISLISFLVGLVVEHFTGLLSSIFSFFM